MTYIPYTLHFPLYQSTNAISSCDLTPNWERVSDQGNRQDIGSLRQIFHVLLLLFVSVRGTYSLVIS